MCVGLYVAKPERAQSDRRRNRNSTFPQLATCLAAHLLVKCALLPSAPPISGQVIAACDRGQRDDSGAFEA